MRTESYTQRQSFLSKKRKQRQWDLYFLELAFAVSKKSCDTSMHVGCVIVGPDNEIRSTGYNGFCRECEPNEERLTRPAKYDWTEHGERNAIYNAARMGVSLKGCTAYISCDPREKGGTCPCLDCTRAFIQSGIVQIVEYIGTSVQAKEKTGAWRDKLDLSMGMLKEAGVKLRLVNDKA